MIGKNYPYTFEDDLAHYVLQNLPWTEKNLAMLLRNPVKIWDWSTFAGGACSGDGCDFVITSKNLAKLKNGVGLCPSCDKLVFVASSAERDFGPLFDIFQDINLLDMPVEMSIKKKSKTKINGASRAMSEAEFSFMIESMLGGELLDGTENEDES